MDTANHSGSITLAELTTELRDGTIDEFWNVLTDKYFTGEFIPGSRRVPLDRVGRELAATELPRAARIVVYCAGPFCPQSHQAVEKLRAFGYTDVRSYDGGLQEWKDSGRAIVHEPRIAAA